MANRRPDIKADIKTAGDRGENVSLMEPLLIAGDSTHRPELTELAFELAQKSTGFRLHSNARIPPDAGTVS
jgi:hypothetical protein